MTNNRMTPTERNARAIAARSITTSGGLRSSALTPNMTETDAFAPFADSPAGEAVNEHVRLATLYKDAVRDLRAHRDAQGQAVAADRAALQEAVVAGESDPGDKAQEAWKAEETRLSRRTDALADAVAASYADMLDALADAHDEIVDAANAKRRDASTALLEALDVVTANAEAMAAAAAVVALIDKVADEGVALRKMPRPRLAGIIPANTPAGFYNAADLADLIRANVVDGVNKIPEPPILHLEVPATTPRRRGLGGASK